MKKVTGVSFMSLEFDFRSKGMITSEVFVELDDDGEKSRIQHKTELQNVSFSDFLNEESITDLVIPENDFSSYLQFIRKMITLKVASDLNLDVADMEYDVVEPTRGMVEQLQQEGQLVKAQNNALSERADFIEDVVAEMATQVYQ